MKKLENKVIAITGGNSGIGLAIAHLAQNEGALVAIFGRNKATMTSALAALNKGTLGVLGDVQNISEIQSFISQVKLRLGHIDAIIINAGEGKTRDLRQIDENFFNTVSNINFRGAYFTAINAIPHMNDGGSITFISSIARIKGLAGLTIYSATKAAVRSLARSLAAELSDRQIRVNSISPGGVTTPFLQRDGISEKEIVESIKAYSLTTPAGRMALPQEIASVAVFISSSEASYINGADIAVDGGYGQI